MGWSVVNGRRHSQQTQLCNGLMHPKRLLGTLLTTEQRFFARVLSQREASLQSKVFLNPKRKFRIQWHNQREFRELLVDGSQLWLLDLDFSF